MTSHPKDLSSALMLSIKECPKVCHHLHLPVQSGSNAVLEKMHRGYTREEYMERVQSLRQILPDISITSDVMVGFPGEREKDFLDTLDLMKEVQFEEAYTYKYSVRPGTAAADMADDVPEEEKKKRLTELIRLQREITREKYKNLIGKIFEVLYENKSSRNETQWWGKTRSGRPVVIENKEASPGLIGNVKIVNSTGATLIAVAI
jgi:tRNA-2-methylthio-N6-dimethylallyladenosine synthase